MLLLSPDTPEKRRNIMTVQLYLECLVLGELNQLAWYKVVVAPSDESFLWLTFSLMSVLLYRPDP